MRWVDALKIWNSKKTSCKGTWCIPKKGTKAHKEVMAIMDKQMRPKRAKKASKKIYNRNEIVPAINRILKDDYTYSIFDKIEFDDDKVAFLHSIDKRIPLVHLPLFYDISPSIFNKEGFWYVEDV